MINDLPHKESIRQRGNACRRWHRFLGNPSTLNAQPSVLSLAPETDGSSNGTAPILALTLEVHKHKRCTDSVQSKHTSRLDGPKKRSRSNTVTSTGVSTGADLCVTMVTVEELVLWYFLRYLCSKPCSNQRLMLHACMMKTRKGRMHDTEIQASLPPPSYSSEYARVHLLSPQEGNCNGPWNSPFANPSPVRGYQSRQRPLRDSPENILETLQVRAHVNQCEIQPRNDGAKGQEIRIAKTISTGWPGESSKASMCMRCERCISAQTSKQRSSTIEVMISIMICEHTSICAPLAISVPNLQKTKTHLRPALYEEPKSTDS